MSPGERPFSRSDPVSFGRLLREYDSDLRGVAWSVVRNRDAVDDVMQSAYEKAFRSIDEFRGGSSLKTWLHTICYRAAIDHIRREGRRSHLPLSSVEQTEGGDPVSDRALDQVEVGRLLDMLEPQARSMVMMTSVLGMSFDEVAAITETPRGTVASKVSRARETLRKAAD